MNKLYFKKTSNLDGFSSIKLINHGIDTKDIIEFNGVDYGIETELSKDSVILGYAVVSKRKNKKVKIDEKLINTSINNEIAVLKETEGRKIIGYIRAEKEDTYIGIVKEKSIFIMLLLFFIMSLLFISLYSNTNNTKEIEIENEKTTEIESGTDDKGNGALDSVKPEFAEQSMFRMRLNMTPTLKNEKMNIRIESPKKENKDFMFTVEVYVLQKIDKNDAVITSFGEEGKKIYTSPVIYADENIEYATVDENLSDGKYRARALYKIYKIDGTFIGQTACKLTLRVE